MKDKNATEDEWRTNERNEMWKRSSFTKTTNKTKTKSIKYFKEKKSNNHYEKFSVHLLGKWFFITQTAIWI